MRVVVKRAPDPVGLGGSDGWGGAPRIAGSYGKVVRVIDDTEMHQVLITGHVDGGPVDAMAAEIGWIDRYHSDELEVVD